MRVGGDDGVGKSVESFWRGAGSELSCGKRAVIFSTGIGTPIIPVEEGKTSSGRTLVSSFAACWHTLWRP